MKKIGLIGLAVLLLTIAVFPGLVVSKAATHATCTATCTMSDDWVLGTMKMKNGSNGIYIFVHNESSSTKLLRAWAVDQYIYFLDYAWANPGYNGDHTTVASIVPSGFKYTVGLESVYYCNGNGYITFS